MACGGARSPIGSFGDEITSTSNDREKFATYTRDSYTGLDYADQRFYASSYGRFNSPDPYRATPTSPTDPGAPQGWNRYAYVTGDPINLMDPGGTCGTPSTFSETGGVISISVSIPCEGGGSGGNGGPVLTPQQGPPSDGSSTGPVCSQKAAELFKSAVCDTTRTRRPGHVRLYYKVDSCSIWSVPFSLLSACSSEVGLILRLRSSRCASRSPC